MPRRSRPACSKVLLRRCAKPPANVRGRLEDVNQPRAGDLRPRLGSSVHGRRPEAPSCGPSPPAQPGAYSSWRDMLSRLPMARRSEALAIGMPGGGAPGEYSSVHQARTGCRSKGSHRYSIVSLPRLVDFVLLAERRWLVDLSPSRVPRVS